MINILIAEDDEILRGLYEEWLPELLSGHRDTVVVSILPDGREVGSLLNRSSYDITILDMALPGMSGPDLFKKYNDKMGNIILASTYADIFNSVLKSSRECLILNKPFTKEDLKHKLDLAMEANGYAYKRTTGSSEIYSSVD